MNEITLLEVGGCVRDGLLGIPTKDIDFVALINSPQGLTIEDGFQLLHDELVADGFKIWELRPEHVTIRGQFPAHLQEKYGGVRDADFVLARREGPYSDRRRPDWVELGTLKDDLARRDFTVNAIARDARLGLIDPFDGQRDLANGVLRFVGNPMDRITEDGVRILRGLRFEITKNLEMDDSAWDAITSVEAAEFLAEIADEPRGAEIKRMFETDTLASLELIAKLPRHTVEAMFSGSLHLTSSMKKV